MAREVVSDMLGAYPLTMVESMNLKRLPVSVFFLLFLGIGTFPRLIQGCRLFTRGGRGDKAGGSAGIGWVKRQADQGNVVLARPQVAVGCSGRRRHDRSKLAIFMTSVVGYGVLLRRRRPGVNSVDLRASAGERRAKGNTPGWPVSSCSTVPLCCWLRV